MDTIDRSDESMSENLGTHDNPFGAGERTVVPPGRSGGVFRRITRNWWQILLAWLVLAAPLTYLVYRYVEPTYTAFGMIKVESYEPDLFGSSMGRDGSGTQPTYLLTEIETIRSNPVLDLALTRHEPSIMNYPLFKESKDPKNDLRSKLVINVLPNTHWIRVAIESTAPFEARDIVNAVINAYQDTVVSESLGTPTANKVTAIKQLVKKITEGFKAYKDGLEVKINAAKDKLRELARRDDQVASKVEQESKGDRVLVKLQGVKTWNSHLNEIEASFLRDDLNRYYNMFDQVNRKLELFEFTKDNAGIEIQRIDEAELPKVPNSNERLRYMALLPVAVLVSVLGLFLVFARSSPKTG
jgi:capsular polysaccharide biosynthesis protein